MGDFYQSKEWVALKKKVYKRYGRRCMATQWTEKDGITLSIDHIKPRLKYPRLALSMSNMQVLELGLNKTKSDRIISDFRPLRWRLYYKSKWLLLLGLCYAVATPSTHEVINAVILLIQPFLKSLNLALISVYEAFAPLIGQLFRLVSL